MSDFALRALARTADGKPFRSGMRRMRVKLPAAVDKRLGAKERRSLEAHSVAELIDTPAAELSRKFNLSRDEVSALKLAHLGVPMRAVDNRGK